MSIGKAYEIRVKMSNGIDEYFADSPEEANRIISTACGFERCVMAWYNGEKIFDNVNETRDKR